MIRHSLPPVRNGSYQSVNELYKSYKLRRECGKRPHKCQKWKSTSMDGWAKGKYRGGFYFIIYLFFPPPLRTQNDDSCICTMGTWQWRISSLWRGKEKLRSWTEVSHGDELKLNLHNNVLPLQYPSVPTLNHQPHCDHSLLKKKSNSNELIQKPRAWWFYPPGNSAANVTFRCHWQVCLMQLNWLLYNHCSEITVE